MDKPPSEIQGPPVVVAAAATTTATASAEAIKEEFITQRMKTWLAKAQDVRPHEYLSRFFSLSVNGNVAPEANDFMVISCQGQCKLIPLDDDSATDPQLRERSEVLGRWAANPVNKHILAEIEQLLVKEIREKIWWFTQEDIEAVSVLGILERVKQYTKVCAKTRLRGSAIANPWNSANISARTRCRFCVCNVSKLGAVSMEWAYLPWSASLNDFLRHVRNTPAFAPDFEFADALPHLLKRLEFLDYLDRMTDEVKAIKTALEAEPIPVNNATWIVSLCNFENSDVDGRTWIPITSDLDFIMVLRTAKLDNKLLVFIRPWQERLYRLSYEIRKLENDTASLEAEDG